MEKMRLAPCGVQISDFLNPDILKRVTIYSCRALRSTPMTVYVMDDQRVLQETDFLVVSDFNYSDCWQMRDAGNYPAMQE